MINGSVLESAEYPGAVIVRTCHQCMCQVVHPKGIEIDPAKWHREDCPALGTPARPHRVEA
jgi:hypothetical protein